MKVRVIGFFSSVVWTALVLGLLRWMDWIDNQSVAVIVFAVILVTFLDAAWRWLWKRREKKCGLESAQPKQLAYSSFELAGYLMLDAFHWLKQKMKH